MASIKVKFRPSTIEGKEGTVYYQIIHERCIRQLLTAHKLLPSEWDNQSSRPVLSAGSERRRSVAAIYEQIRLDLNRLNVIIRRLEGRPSGYGADDIVAEFRLYTHRCSLFRFMRSIIATMQKRQKVRSAEIYTVVLNSFRRFRANEDIMLDALTHEVVESYEHHLQTRGNVPNTTSFYMRVLRATYNRAVEEGLIDDGRPFRHVYTGIDKTVKRALPLAALRRIKGLDLTTCPAADYARDMFMLSFYLRGMSFVDMAFLRDSDLAQGYVTYRRAKTGQLLRIAWTKEMQSIIDKYPTNAAGYLLPILSGNHKNAHKAYRNIAYNINHNLKQIAGMVNVDMPLTLYCARHSWASVARAKGVPLSVISVGMGHDSEITTQIYLDSLDTSAIDHANSRIIGCL